MNVPGFWASGFPILAINLPADSRRCDLQEYCNRAKKFLVHLAAGLGEGQLAKLRQKLHMPGESPTKIKLLIKT